MDTSGKDPFIFIFSQNNSGTTVLSQFLSSNIKSSYLPPFGNYEGQWIPQVRPIMRNEPWKTKSQFNWKLIKQTWINNLQQAHCDFFIEASPPNMIRVNQILKHFSPIQCIFFVSNPYLQIASSIHRYAEKEDFDQAIRRFSEQWIQRAKIQINNCKKYYDIPLVTYEEFCKNPSKILNKLDNLLKIDAIHQQTSTRIEGKKNSQINTIHNMTPKHISFLGAKGLQDVNKILEENRDIPEYFGYKPVNLKQANQILRRNPMLANEGLLNRIEWNRKNLKSSQ